MKKLFFVLLILFTITSCHSDDNRSKQRIDTNKASKPQKESQLTTNVTLNNISQTDASNMIAAFDDDNTSSDVKTAIWLSRPWINAIYQLLSTEKTKGADGFRIYFAKTVTDNKNTVVIVSTKHYQDDSNAESKEDHLDYFDHDWPNLDPADAKLTIEREGSNKGAKMYGKNSPCTSNDCNIEGINYIACDSAYKAVKHFGEKKHKTINTNSEWFPLDLLKNLKEELDAAENANLIVPDGIRIYFAKYAKDNSSKKRKNKNCFIITTTKNTHVDYYECYAPEAHKFVDLKDNGEQCPNNCYGVTLP